MSQWPRTNRGMRALLLATRAYSQYTLRSKSLHDRFRQYSSVITTRSDDVNVKVGSGGYITLNIYRTPNTSNPTPTILFLPRGPIAATADLQPENELLPLLSLHSSSTVVCINYRLSTDGRYQFPRPVHDVLAGYDWVLKHLVHDAVPSEGPSAYGRPKTVGAYGELVGGGLAAMLALTESHIGKRGIGAAAAANPIVDWTFPDAVADEGLERDGVESVYTNVIGKRKASSKTTVTDSWTSFGKQGVITADDLLSIRQRIFPKPEYYFDPFASPLLFFRTPGVDVPADESSMDSPDAPSTISEEVPSTKRRKAHRRFPPSGSRLRLPSMRISLGEENLLRDQGVAVAELMRRSIVMHERRGSDVFSDPWVDESEKVAEVVNRAREEAERRVQLIRQPGVGFQAIKTAADGAEEMMDVGRWFKDVLR